jgi:hypothetical protein
LPGPDLSAGDDLVTDCCAGSSQVVRPGWREPRTDWLTIGRTSPV